MRATPAKQPPARVHPDDRAKIAAANTVEAVYHGVPQPPAKISYYSPILIQCTLPHSDPKAAHWIKQSGSRTLIVSSGIDKQGKTYGVPYGKFPRMVLAYVITCVKKTGECRVEFDRNFKGFLNEVGYTANLNKRQKASIIDQLNRLIRATFSWEGGSSKEHSKGGGGRVTSDFDLWFNDDHPDQITMFDSFIMVSQEFRDAIIDNPVPLRTDILKALKGSSLDLDVYMWLSYRLFTMKTAGEEAIELSYGLLQQQFGTGIAEADYRKFRQRLKNSMRKVAQYWQGTDGEKQRLNFDFTETHLILYRSPLLIENKSSAAEDEARQIMASRSFDMETRKKARQIAAGWDVNWLIGQYFEWIEKHGTTPKNPKLHLFQFIRSHVKRNGKIA